MVLVTGSLAFDLIMDYPGFFEEHINPDKIHILNLSFLVDSLKKERGGTGGNIAYNLGLLKTPVSIIASAGNDFAKYKKFLSVNGVNTSLIKVTSKDTSSQAFIMNDKKDNQITSFYPGAMKLAKNLSIKTSHLKPDIVVIAPNDPLAMSNYVNECQNLKLPYLYDPGMQLPRLTDIELKRGIAKAKILIGNDYEINLIKKRLKTSDYQLLKKVEILIKTLGENGSEIKTNKKRYKIKAVKPKKMIDPTGAGDAYRGGFLAGLLKGLDLQICGQMGSTAACYAIENYGTTNHYFTVKEFKRRYRENYKKELIYENA